ncbi:MAG: hypothetical protein SGARI_003183, partial [Bacillariaceae sp.]
MSAAEDSTAEGGAHIPAESSTSLTPSFSRLASTRSEPSSSTSLIQDLNLAASTMAPTDKSLDARRAKGVYEGISLYGEDPVEDRALIEDIHSFAYNRMERFCHRVQARKNGNGGYTETTCCCGNDFRAFLHYSEGEHEEEVELSQQESLEKYRPVFKVVVDIVRMVKEDPQSNDTLAFCFAFFKATTVSSTRNKSPSVMFQVEDLICTRICTNFLGELF